MTIDSVEATLKSLEGVDGALVVVDNDSGDGSYDILRKAMVDRGWDKGPQNVRVVQSGWNGGYGAGNNVGMRAGLPDGSEPDFIFIVNSDAFPEAGAVTALLAHMAAHPRTGFAGSLIYGKDGAIHNTACRFPTILSEIESQLRLGPVSRLLNNVIVSQPIPLVLTKTDWLAGASLMIRKATLDEVGLFDEDFFLYFEETDLSHRAAKKGWDSYFVPESRAMHIGSVSTGMKKWSRIPSYWLDSRMRYFVKNYGVFYAGIATLAHITCAGLWRIRKLVQGKPKQDPEYYLRDLILHTLRSCVSGLGGNKKHRVQTQPGE